jgi:2,4-dienoyl-CoA reductase (NADPH2)
MTDKRHPQFPHLFSPTAIKNVELRNRIAVTAHMGGWMVDGEGLPNDAYRAYLEERAKGGVALYTIGATATRYDGGAPLRNPNWLLNLDDRFTPRYRMLADAAHRHGCKLFAQLIHRGDPPQPGALPLQVWHGQNVPRAASAPPLRANAPPPPRTVEDLQDIGASIARGARRAVEGGVDGVELHAHEGYLFAQLLSPRENVRTDQYGGSLENRSRLMVETLRAMREAVGSDVPIGVRLRGDDAAPGGMTLDDYIELVRMIEAMGLVDYFHITAGTGQFGPMNRPEGEALPNAGRIREHTRLPVMHAGNITDPFMAEQALADGMVDVVGMTRTHIADPHFTRKVFEGRLDDIRYCMRCVQSCIGKMEYLTCVYNPVTGREREWAELQPATLRKRVVVVGAGPAGMEAALIAAERGHDVVVLERSDRVGGQVWAAAAAPLRRKFGEVASFYERQARKGLFDVRLNVDADADAVLALKPDAVVVATGSVPRPASVPVEGQEAPRPATTVLEALGLPESATSSGRAVIIDREGQMRAFVVADLLNDRGMDVEFLSPFFEVGTALTNINVWEVPYRLGERGVRFRPGEDVLWWKDDRTLAVADVIAGERRTIEDVDLLVVAAGSESHNGLAPALAGRAPGLELHVIGDACAPRTVEEATSHGGRVGRVL